jgi:hypothetical protein
LNQILVVKPLIILSEQTVALLERILNDEKHKLTFIAMTSADYNGEKLL